MSIDPNKFGISKSLIDAVNEALKGGQVKLDKNHNGKLDSQDFKMLRKEEGGDKTNPKQGSSVDPKQREIDEKSVSKAQQHAAGAALATQRGEYDGGKKGGAINRMASMKTSELRKFAGTKTKSLPTHKEEVVDEGNADNKAKKNAAVSAVGAKNRDDHYLDRMNPTVADKIRGREKMSGKDRQWDEEVEQVDELSKATLGSYIKKAATDVATNSAATGRHAERSNKIADHQKKTGDYSKETQRRKDSQTADKAFDKSWKRRQGINKATDKLTKEEVVDEAGMSRREAGAHWDSNKKAEKKSDTLADYKNKTAYQKAALAAKKKVSEGVEQVDELSKSTLGSYVNKSAASLGKAGYKAGSTDGTAAKLDPYIHTINKRSAGIKRAVGKLAKEDTQIDELSTDTYHSAAHKAAKKAMGDAQGRSGPIFKKYAGMANKFRDKGMSQEKKEKIMKEENIDEAGRVLPDLSQKEPEKKHSKDYLSRMPKKRDSGLWKAYVKTGAKWAKPDHVKEETLDEIQGTYGNGGNKKNLKIIHKGVVVKDYGTDTKPNKATRDKKAEKMGAYRADRDKNMEEEIQIDEISKGTLASYGYKAGRQMQGNQPSDPDKFRKRTNREKGSKLAYGKYYGHKVKVPATEETDPGFAEAKTMTKVKTTKDIGYKVVDVGPGQKEKIVKAHNWTEPKKKLPNGADYAAQRRKERLAANGRMDEATENPITKELAAKKTEIQKSIAQKKMQVMQAKAQKQMAAMKEAKCTCTEGKKSMTCETHGDKAMGMKGGKEPIQMNPPLRD
jgi:hypothetical protein